MIVNGKSRPPRKTPSTRRTKKPTGVSVCKKRNSFEDRVSNLLDSLKVSFEYEPKDKKISYTVPESYHKYLPDFVVGNTYYETKGQFPVEDRKKMKLLVEQHPDKRFVMVFQRDNYIRKGSKTKYSDWCIKNNIEFVMYNDLERHVKNINI